MICGHPNNECRDLIVGSWTAWATSMDKVPFLGDQFAMPSQQVIGCYEGFALSEKLASNGFGSDRQAATLGVGEVNLSITKFRF